jgi:hypothetical protein
VPADRTIPRALALASLLVLGFAGCGGGGDGGDIAAPKQAWKDTFLFAGFTDLSASPMIDGKTGRYTPATVKTLEECGAGGDELEQAQDSVKSALQENLRGGPRSDEVPDFTTTDGSFKFGFSGAPTRYDTLVEIQALSNEDGSCHLFHEKGEGFSSGRFD